MAISPEQVDEWRTKLLELRSSLEQELSDSNEASRPVDLSQPIGRLTRMDAMQQQHMAIARRGRIQDRLKGVSAALGRLEGGTFGECLWCMEDIEIRRLQARPETFLCLSCQQNRE